MSKNFSFDQTNHEHILEKAKKFFNVKTKQKACEKCLEFCDNKLFN